jgi:hypothetical protein
VEEDRPPDVVGSALRERLGGFTRGATLSERIKSMDIRREDLVGVELDEASPDDDPIE